MAPHWGCEAVSKCGSHSGRCKLQSKNEIDANDWATIGKCFEEINAINITYYDSLSSIMKNSQGVCCNENIECGDVLDMYHE